MSQTEHSRTIVIGVGNDFRSDDAAGLYISRKLRKSLKNNFTYTEITGDGSELIYLWKGFDNIIIIDAVYDRNSTGKLYKIDLVNTNIPKNLSISSSHLFSIPQAVESAKAINALPNKIVLYGLSVKNFKLGNIISEEIKKAADKAVNRIIKDLS